MPSGATTENLTSSIVEQLKPQQIGRKHMEAMLNPLTLSDEPSTTEFHLPTYDWNKQTRHDTIVAGKSTLNSIQTFDSKGHPKDSQNDNND